MNSAWDPANSPGRPDSSKMHHLKINKWFSNTFFGDRFERATCFMELDCLESCWSPWTKTVSIFSSSFLEFPVMFTFVFLNIYLNQQWKVDLNNCICSFLWEMNLREDSLKALIIDLISPRLLLKDQTTGKLRKNIKFLLS